MDESRPVHLDDLRRAFFEDLAVTEDYTRTRAEEALSGGALVGPERSEALERLRSRLTTEEDRKAFAAAVSESVHVAIHSVLVAIDGGSATADVGRVYLVDESGESLGEGLHDLFVGHLFDTGRMT